MKNQTISIVYSIERFDTGNENYYDFAVTFNLDIAQSIIEKFIASNPSDISRFRIIKRTSIVEIIE